MARATAQRYLEHCDWAVDARLVQPVPDVLKALEILHKELDITMAFCGHTNIQTVDRNILLAGTYPT